MTAIVDIQRATALSGTPSDTALESVVNAVFSDQNISDKELTIRLVDIDESQSLNHMYRHKDKPTNVLSFMFEGPEGIEFNLLGDLVVCAEIVKNEALEQKKQLIDHWTHMIVHGTLHLLGFDHENEQDADEMENIEKRILSKLNIDDPYQDHQL